MNVAFERDLAWLRVQWWTAKISDLDDQIASSVDSAMLNLPNVRKRSLLRLITKTNSLLTWIG